MILLSKFIEYIKNSSTSFPLLVLIILIAIFITTLIIIINTLVTVKKQKIVIPPSALNSNIVSNINRSKIKTNNINPFLWLLSEKLNKFLIKKGYIK